MKKWVIREKLFDALGEWTESRTIKTIYSDNKPNLKLGKNQALFQSVSGEIYDRRLAYPAAFGLSGRQGV